MECSGQSYAVFHGLLPRHALASSRFSESSPFSQWVGKEPAVYCTGGFSCTRPGTGTHHFHPHPVSQNSGTWLCPTSREAKKFSLAMCWVHSSFCHKGRQIAPQGRPMVPCLYIIRGLQNKCTVLFLGHLMPIPTINILVSTWKKSTCQDQHQPWYHHKSVHTANLRVYI